MLPRQGIRSSCCSTVAIPALVTCTVTDFVEPSVTGTSTPEDETSNFCATACGKTRSVVPILAERGELDWQRRSDERTEAHARLERMPPRSLM
jgi:hypothetical protein